MKQTILIKMKDGAAMDSNTNDMFTSISDVIQGYTLSTDILSFRIHHPGEQKMCCKAPIEDIEFCTVFYDGYGQQGSINLIPRKQETPEQSEVEGDNDGTDI